MNRISVDLAGNGYDILVESGALDTVAAQIEPYLRNDRVFLITDTNVAARWLEPVKADLQYKLIK